MALSFAQLIQPSTQAQELAQLVAALQGVGFVTHSAGGSAPVGSGTVTVSGPALQATSVVVQIASSGQLGTGTFTYSLDGGNSFSSAITIPTNGIYVMPTNGVTVSFSNGLYTPPGGSFQAGETYSWATNVPTFPITNWTSGGVANTLIQIDAQALASLSQTEALIAAGGLVLTSTGPWLDLLAQNLYTLTRGQPSQTQGNIVLVCNSVAGPYTIQPGQLFAADITYGNVFYNLTGGTLASNSSLTLLFGAVQTGSKYNQVPPYNPSYPGNGGIINLQTPLPGVTISNPLQAGAPIHIGTGSGTLTTSGTPTGPGYNQVSVTITASGTPGTGTFVYQIDGGTAVGPITIPSTAYAFGALGVSGTFAGSFEIGDTYIFSTNWITQLGSDVELDSSLQQRCINQWQTLAAGSPSGVYVNWAKAASPEVVYVKVSVDATVAGQVDILLAGAGDAPVSSAAVAAVQAYVDARIPLTSSAVVSNVTTFTVTATGNVYCPSAVVPSVTSGIVAALAQIQVAVGIGGTVYLSEVEGAIQAITGVRNIESLELNGSAADVVLTSTQVAAMVNSMTVVGF